MGNLGTSLITWIRNFFDVEFIIATQPQPRMTSAETRKALPFSESEKVFQSPPYVYTSGTVPVKENDADYVFYQSWTDARAEQKNVDVLLFKYNLMRNS